MWQPEVNKLLDLKKQLEAAKVAHKNTSTTSSESVASLEKSVAEQVLFCYLIVLGSYLPLF